MAGNPLGTEIDHFDPLASEPVWHINELVGAFENQQEILIATHANLISVPFCDLVTPDLRFA
ncbi:MAG: hypothetical protein JWP89_828 [Schlesneria sp.]|nr:hypothetical protein [Schlesneria sp.]